MCETRMEPLPVEWEQSGSTAQQPNEKAQQQLSAPTRPPFRDPSWMTRNIRTEKKVAVISHMDIRATTVPVTSAEGYTFLCSYSWKQADTPTIYVPGTPRKWNPPPLPIQMKKDKGLHWVDQHAHRVPKYQFEPIFQSLAIMNPKVQFDDVDVVVNRNTLQKLYHFASLKRNKQFYVDLDIVGKTLFIGRKERNAKTMATSGHGRNFENIFTSGDPSLVDADGHHRVIKYNLGGVNMVLRMETDSYHDSKDVEVEADATTLDEFFLDVLGTIAPASAVIVHSNYQHTRAIPRGTLLPHNQTLECKSNHDKNSTREQVWFGRTSHLVFGKHKQGFVKETQTVHLQRDDFKAWEIKNQENLRRLVWLLQEVRRVAMDKTSGAAILVVIENGAPLQIFEAKQSYGALPKEIIERFWGEEVTERH